MKMKSKSSVSKMTHVQASKTVLYSFQPYGGRRAAKTTMMNKPQQR